MSERELPSEEQYLKMSRRGLVAFVARCLRRVQTLPSYQEAHQAIGHAIQALWQFPRDPSDQPEMARHRAEIERHWNEVDLPLVVIACEAALQALSEAGGNAPRWARDVAVAAENQASLEWGHYLCDLIHNDVEALCELAPGPFPEIGRPFDETELERLSPLWPDGGTPPWSRQA